MCLCKWSHPSACWGAESHLECFIWFCVSVSDYKSFQWEGFTPVYLNDFRMNLVPSLSSGLSAHGPLCGSCDNEGLTSQGTLVHPGGRALLWGQWDNVWRLASWEMDSWKQTHQQCGLRLCFPVQVWPLITAPMLWDRRIMEADQESVYQPVATTVCAEASVSPELKGKKGRN